MQFSYIEAIKVLSRGVLSLLEANRSIHQLLRSFQRHIEIYAQQSSPDTNPLECFARKSR